MLLVSIGGWLRFGLMASSLVAGRVRHALKIGRGRIAGRLARGVTGLAFSARPAVSLGQLSSVHALKANLSCRF